MLLFLLHTFNYYPNEDQHRLKYISRIPFSILYETYAFITGSQK